MGNKRWMAPSAAASGLAIRQRTSAHGRTAAALPRTRGRMDTLDESCGPPSSCFDPHPVVKPFFRGQLGRVSTRAAPGCAGVSDARGGFEAGTDSYKRTMPSGGSLLAPYAPGPTPTTTPLLPLQSPRYHRLTRVLSLRHRTTATTRPWHLLPQLPICNTITTVRLTHLALEARHVCSDLYRRLVLVDASRRMHCAALSVELASISWLAWEAVFLHAQV
ncbi:hypothetical protein FB567DRAFT_215309 [Paraphoma chrysanthemicola]|uniref:Uncharacterized protein n=1 Tax=Paraphoma chrysanthemicola TaxID=798071 RepID=A0A8K0VSJ3_9PLEO|nr:hypothetical protein FB567DRAFT_215309 [Paraphoma chrysanthemicola]